MKRHLFLKSISQSFAAAYGLSYYSHSRNKGKNPNILLILADDLGYGDLSCYGAKKVKTPMIDGLAKRGRIFKDAHSTSSICSPSRYGLLTGEYPLRKNFWGPVSSEDPLTISTDKTTLASQAKKSGYSTACIGKWHLGFGEKAPDWNGELKPGPLEVGFDYYYGVPQVNSGPPFVYVENHKVVGLEKNDPFVYKKESVTQKWPEKMGTKKIGGAEKAHRLYRDEEVGTHLKDKAVEWLDDQNKKYKDKPFFMYYSMTHIHHPFTPAPRFKGTSECGLYGDFIHEMDWVVGELLASLKKMGKLENTIVIFTSDNGGMFNNTAQKAFKAGHNINGSFLGYKGGAWEGGHRVPMIASWPGHIPTGSMSNHLFSHVDLLATLSYRYFHSKERSEGQH